MDKKEAAFLAAVGFLSAVGVGLLIARLFEREDSSECPEGYYWDPQIKECIVKPGE